MFHKLGLDHTALIHGCSLGLKSVAYPDKYIKKPWKLKATFAALAEVSQHALCPGVSDEHVHTPCAGADTKLSESYTTQFVSIAHQGILAHACHIADMRARSQVILDGTAAKSAVAAPCIFSPGDVSNSDVMCSDVLPQSMIITAQFVTPLAIALSAQFQATAYQLSSIL